MRNWRRPSVFVGILAEFRGFPGSLTCLDTFDRVGDRSAVPNQSASTWKEVCFFITEGEAAVRDGSSHPRNPHHDPVLQSLKGVCAMTKRLSAGVLLVAMVVLVTAMTVYAERPTGREWVGKGVTNPMINHDLPLLFSSRAGTTWVRVHQSGLSTCDFPDTANSPEGQSLEHVWCFEGSLGDSYLIPIRSVVEIDRHVHDGEVLNYHSGAGKKSYRFGITL